MNDLTALEELLLQWVDNHDGWQSGGETQTCYEDEDDFNVFHIRLNYERIGAEQLRKIRRYLDKYLMPTNVLDITKVILISKSGTNQARIKDSLIAWFIMQRIEKPFQGTTAVYDWEDDKNTLHIKLETY